MDAADALKRMLNISSPGGGGQSPTTPQSSAAIDFSHSVCSHTLPLTGGRISVVASPSSAAAQRSTASPNNLEVMTFSLYNTAPEIYSGRLVAMNDNYVAYGVKLRAGYGVRILHRHTSQRGMVRDHLTPLVDMAFMGDTSDVLATMDQTGHVIVSAVSSGDDASADLIVMRGCHIYDEDNQHVPPQNAFSSGALAWLSCDGHGRLLVGRNGSRAYVCDVSALREAVGEHPINIGAGLFNGIRYVPNISNVTAVSPNSGGTVALAGADGTVSFIDKTSLDVVAMTTAANLGLDTVDHMSFLDENHVLICGNSNSHVVLYHLQQQRELQRLSFKAPGGGMPSLYVSVDASNQYMLLSDTHEATLYVVSFAGAAEKSFSQIREFNSTLPMLSFVCAAATVGETEDMSENAEYNQMKQETRIVVFTAQSKAMQQLTLRFPPSSANENAEIVATNASDQSDSEEVDGVLEQTVTALTLGAFTHDGGDNTAVGRDNSGRDIKTVIHASGDGLELEQSMSATEGIPVLTPTNIRQQSDESTPRHSHTQTPTGTITPTPIPEQPVLPSLDASDAQGRDRSTEHLVVPSDNSPQVHVAATQDKAHAHTQQLQGVTQPTQTQSHGGNSQSQAHARAHEHDNAIANANADAQPQIQILKRGEDAGQATAAATHSPPPKSESIRVVEAASFEKQFGTFRTEMEDSQRALLRLVKESTERNKKVVEEYNDRSLGAVLAAVDKHMSQMRRDLATERQQMVGEIQNSIVAATDRAVLNSITQTVMPQLVMQFEQITRDVAGQVFASKPVIDHITISAAKAMKPALAETFTTAMQEAMIPACEAATREMFRQVSSALTERADTYIDVIRTQSQQFSVAGDVGKSLSNTESAVQQLTQRLDQVSETLDITSSQTAKVLTAVQDSKTAVLMGLKAQQRATASANVPDMLSRQSSSQSVVRSGYTTPTAIPIPEQASQHLTQQQQAQPQQIQQQQQRQVRNDYGNSNAQPMMYQQPPPQQQQQQQQRPPQHQQPQQQQVLQQKQQQPPPQQRQSAAQPQSKLAPGEPPEDLWAAINKLLLAEKYEGAFNKALNAVHLPTLERLCTTLDMERILKSQPPVISQPVLLSLIQQLSTNLQTSTVMKLSVVRTALVSLDRNDKIVQQHRMGLLQQVSNSLKAFKAASPYHPAMSEVERLFQDTVYDRL